MFFMLAGCVSLVSAQLAVSPVVSLTITFTIYFVIKLKCQFLKINITLSFFLFVPSACLFVSQIDKEKFTGNWSLLIVSCVIGMPS